MVAITALETQKHDADRVSIFLDGVFSFGVAAIVSASRGLHVGQELTDAEIEAIRTDDSAEKALAAALNFLSYRPRSSREIETYLRRRGAGQQVIESVVQRVTESGVQDDRAFAHFWMQNRDNFRPRGSRLLRAEMRAKGLDSAIVEEVLEGHRDEDDLAYEAGRARLRTYAPLDEASFRRKMTGFLQRRGFPYAVTLRAVERLATEAEEWRGGIDAPPM